MPAGERSVSWAKLVDVLAGTEEHPGVFQHLLGVGMQTTSLKGVHLMNDVAQCVVGGAPVEGGDLLCRVIRHEHRSDDEDNSDDALRFDVRLGEAYARAFPAEIGKSRVLRLRRGAELLLNADGGMYRAGDRMASSLATHVRLLGAEGFRRFALGRLVAETIGPAGRGRLAELLHDPRDPVTRALRPLFQGDELRDSGTSSFVGDLSPFDLVLGRRLTCLLQQPLSKPVVLRLFVLAASLGLLLKVHGVGRPGGRPTLLGLAETSAHRLLRLPSASAMLRGVSALDDAIVGGVLTREGCRDLFEVAPRTGEPSLVIPTAISSEAACSTLVAAARAFRPGKGQGQLVWPEQCTYALGRRGGFVPKLSGRSPHLKITSELVEALVLMYVPDGDTLSWGEFWARVRTELGIVVGADTYDDRQALEDVGVLNVSTQHLAANADAVLAAAVERGVARRLPDSGAEAGGICGDLH